MQVSFRPQINYQRNNQSKMQKPCFGMVDIKKLVQSVDVDLITQNANIAEIFATKAGDDLINPENLIKLKRAVEKAKTTKKLEAAAYLQDLVDDWEKKIN